MKKLFYNGEVITADKEDSVHQAIVIEEERIMFVGSTQKALKYIDEETETIDLCGCAVLPGFIDSHIHMAVAEAKNGYEIEIGDARCISDLLEKIKQAANERLENEWIIGSGYDYEKLVEARHITIAELDDTARENPVILIHKSGHMSVCNSAAFRVAEKSGLMFPDKDAAKDEQGKFNGLLKETAHFMMLQKAPLLPDNESLADAIESFCKKLLKAGITSCHDAGGYGSATFRSLQYARDNKLLKNKVYTMLWTLFGKEAQIKNAQEMTNLGFYSGLGDDFLKIGPLKIMVDGSAVGGTCATRIPILPDNKIYEPSFSQKEIDEIFVEAHRAGFQLTAHAAGDKAIEMTLNAYEKAMNEFPRRDPRHRIEHCFLCPEKFMPRIKRLGVLPVPNPGFLSIWGNVFEKYYGNRREDVIPLKAFEEYGIFTPFGSDAMVIDRFEPMFGIAAAMERRDLSGNNVLCEKQQIDFLRAVKCYTYFGAYASFEEKEKGSLEAGKLADMTVLSQSVLGKNPEKLRNIKVSQTYVNGKQL